MKAITLKKTWEFAFTDDVRSKNKFGIRVYVGKAVRIEIQVVKNQYRIRMMQATVHIYRNKELKIVCR